MNYNDRSIFSMTGVLRVHSDSNRHRFAAISSRTIRIARPEAVRVAVKALLAFTQKLEKAVAVRISLLERFSANFDAAGK